MFKIKVHQPPQAWYQEERHGGGGTAEWFLTEWNGKREVIGKYRRESAEAIVRGLEQRVKNVPKHKRPWYTIEKA